MTEKNTEIQKEALRNIVLYREYIEEYLDRINTIITVHFPEEFDVAYQHWIPQIQTGLRDDTKWLPRGQYSMEYTLKRIEDKLNISLNKGVTKYIK